MSIIDTVRSMDADRTPVRVALSTDDEAEPGR